MNQKLTRALSVVAAVSMLTAGIAVVVLSESSTPAQAAGTYYIDILPGGFNPPNCTVNRNDSTVKFVNKDSKPRRVVAGDQVEETGEYPLDTGLILPGETQSGGWFFSALDQKTYKDFDNPALTGVIIVPRDENAQSVCSPLPPTPTPTNTPTVTPTPTATPPPPPTPEACARLLNAPKGCNLAPAVASDGPQQ
ncbi:MAG: hypothetical protein KC495_05785 [Dehalococcoidia bacterium]|nr:hypothetical protein [Dehalococcoidia bacterium]MCB9486766.1 hypothetical protein [Thermoflexaceae bacterium]